MPAVWSVNSSAETENVFQSRSNAIREAIVPMEVMKSVAVSKTTRIIICTDFFF